MFTFGPRVDIDCPLRSDAQRSDVLESGPRPWGKPMRRREFIIAMGSVAIVVLSPKSLARRQTNCVSRKKNWNCA